MDIRQLRYFVALKNYGSISKAADALYITKQGLGKSLAALEAELDCILFLRSSSGIVLTDIGEIFFQRANEILDICDDLNGELALQKAKPCRIKIASSYGFFHSMPISFITDFFVENTRGKPEFVARNDFSLDKSMLSEDIDFGFSTNTKQLEGLEYIPLFRNRRCILCNPNHPLASKESIDINDLEGVTLAVPDPRYYFDRDFIAAKCREAGFEGRFEIMHDNAMLIQFPQGLSGVSVFVENPYMQEPLKGLKILTFRESSFSYNVNIVIRKGRKLSQETTRLIEYLLKRCGNEK